MDRRAEDLDFEVQEEDLIANKIKRAITDRQQHNNKFGTGNHDKRIDTLTHNTFLAIPAAEIAVRNSDEQTQRHHFKVM